MRLEQWPEPRMDKHAASVQAKLSADAARAHGVYAVADHGKSDHRVNYTVNRCIRPSDKGFERARLGRARLGESASSCSYSIGVNTTGARSISLKSPIIRIIWWGTQRSIGGAPSSRLMVNLAKTWWLKSIRAHPRMRRTSLGGLPEGGFFANARNSLASCGDRSGRRRTKYRLCRTAIFVLYAVAGYYGFCAKEILAAWRLTRLGARRMGRTATCRYRSREALNLGVRLLP